MVNIRREADSERAPSVITPSRSLEQWLKEQTDYGQGTTQIP